MPTPRAVSRPGPQRPRAAGALLGALLLGAGLPLALAAPAAAHDRLVSTDPADGAPVEVAPDAVALTMSSTPLALGTQVQVSGPAGVVSTGEPRIVDEVVTQALTGERPAGTYEVQWRVTSSDGHPISGSFTFTTARAAGAPGTPSATPDDTPSATDPAAPPSPEASADA
ncbi:copper resistance CopC family protein, partial [Kineococcus sp. SYSU DK006]|uniref:copper resistance CopC family protein n=1 Tax=Kineococcus sp. SYSU DK006 TaxID=3383127 RepID=UPI003D7C5D71